MRLKQILITSLVLLHLVSVAMFIWTDFPEDPSYKLNAALLTYKNLSGSFRDYTFFAPSVSGDLKAAFLLEDSTGHSRLIDFVADNREIEFRYNCIIAACMRDQRARDLFAQSWAALLLGSNPDADKVTVMVKALLTPSMEEYRQGQRPQWKTIYVGEFVRRKDQTTE